MKPSIRSAEESDIPALSDLLDSLFSIESDFTPDADKQQAGLKALLAAPGAIVKVATVDSQVIAMVTAQALISTAEGGAVGLVEDMVVNSAYRGQGIGADLLKALEVEADAKGWTRLQLLVDLDNEPALRFYDHSGWSPTRLAARRKLLPP